MSMALGNINPLSVAYRATETLALKESAWTTATCKNSLPLQIVNRFYYVQGKGVSNDQQY